jgi:RNA polymerase sigma-70 factor (ECF subfamily)
MTEQEAIAALQRGDIQGLAELAARYQVKAIRAAYLIMGDESAAQEVVQNAFLRVYDRIDQYDDKRPFSPWFFRIVTNDAIKAAKRSRREVSLELPVGNGHSPLSDLLSADFPGPDEQVTAVLLREKVWAALEQLSPQQRAAIVMRYYLDMGETEMAERLHIAAGTVKWHLHQARHRLQALLSD